MREQRCQQRRVSFFLLSNMEESHLEFSQLQLHHVLTQGLNEHSREELGVGFHLKQRASGLTGAPCLGVTLAAKTHLSLPGRTCLSPFRWL